MRVICVMALGLIGGLVSAIGSVASAGAQANAANAQAAAAQRQAAAERLHADYNASQQHDKNVSLISKQRAGYLASGLSLQGSPTDIIADTTRQSELDVSAIRFNGEIKAQNFEMQAAAYRAKADAAQVGGMFGAISPMIKGFGGMSGGSGGFGGDGGADFSGD